MPYLFNALKEAQELFLQFVDPQEAAKPLCDIIARATEVPSGTDVRITINGTVYTTENFFEGCYAMNEEFHLPNKKKVTIEVFGQQPFTTDEKEMLHCMVGVIASHFALTVYNKITDRGRERIKELNTIGRVNDIISRKLPLEETLCSIAAALSYAFMHPDDVRAKIVFNGKEYAGRECPETPWSLKADFVTINDRKGQIVAYYRHEKPAQDEGPFLKEEKDMLEVVARLIGGYINDNYGRDLYVNRAREKETAVNEDFRKVLTKNQNPLQLFFNKQSVEKYVYLDMMKYKVHNILFVATLYDAFTLENDDSFFEQYMGEIYQYSLFSLPRITGVSSADDALELLKTTRFDMAILMIGLDSDATFRLSADIKQLQPNIPVFLLASQKSGIREVERRASQTPSVDKVFVWGGDSNILFSIVKSTEDEANAENDTKVGLVRVILLVEDSPEYYSKYLRMLFSIIFSQVQKLLQEDDRNEINRVSKMRQRPKILHARNYEDAVYLIEKYKDYLLCVISDVEFERDGALDPMAGYRLLKQLQFELPTLPTIMQSADLRNKQVADSLGVSFLHKDSETLKDDLVQFLTARIGFGDFVFQNKQGKPIAKAKGFKEFETIFRNIPSDLLSRYCRDFRISSWLMSRGEIPLARKVNPINFDDYANPDDFRADMLRIMDEYRANRRRGKRLDYDEVETPDEKNIISLASGALGGKGRGLAFINTLIQNIDTSEFDNDIHIRIPITAIVGTDEFSAFMERGQLHDFVMKEEDYTVLRERFASVDLSEKLMKRLRRFVSQVHRPIAVRSSSLSEDSMNQPFAGVFDTYLVPNNSKDPEENVRQIATAIKMVYASIYSPTSRAYFQTIKMSIEKEKMAVVIQVLVGNEYQGYYYPHVSGTAQSFNYYPVAHMQPEEGFAVAGFGLGYYVVGGSKAYRFSPAWPAVETMSVSDIVKNTQVDFLAVDLSKEHADYVHDGEKAPLATLDIMDAERHGTLKHCASVYDPQNDTLEAGLETYGPRVVNFADILKYNYVPLPRLLSVVLNYAKDAFGTPIEIEWALDLEPDDNGRQSFYLLQMKPIITDLRGDSVKVEEPSPENSILYTTQSLGNGNVKGITDIIFADPDAFDKLQTEQMAKEIEYLNGIMMDEGRHYVLIGPGRWGTRDKYIGIPVAWSQISMAKLIVEMSLPGFALDSSLGSHFFHNVTSMNIGYLSVQSESTVDHIDWDNIKKLKEVRRTTFFRQVRADNELDVRMNGKERRAAIQFKGPNQDFD